MNNENERLLFADKDGVVIPFSKIPIGTVRRPYDGTRVFVNPEWDPGISETVQGDAPQADINLIVKRYHMGEPLPQIENGQFMDVSEIGSYEDVQSKIAEMQALFMSYPAEIRARFLNSAAKFADFVVDPANVDEGRQLGLFAPEPPPVVEPVPAAKPA